jgi:hypothetical protein
VGRNESFCVYLFDPATWPTSRVVGPTRDRRLCGESGSPILSGSYLAASSPDQAEVTEMACSSVLSNDFSGSESESRRYLYGTFDGGDIRISFSRILFRVYNIEVKRNNISDAIDSLPTTAA